MASLSLFFTLLAAFLSLGSSRYIFTPTTDNQVSGAVYYFDNAFCQGAPLVAFATYNDFVAGHSGQDEGVACDINSQCALNYAAQKPGFCHSQIVKVNMFNDTYFETSVAGAVTDPFSDGLGLYDNPSSEIYSLDGCYVSRSYVNCYFNFVPIENVYSSPSSSVISSFFVTAFSLVFGALFAF